MNVRVSVFVGTFLALALAQVEPGAAQLLERARAALGSALASIRTYQETATLTTYNTGQVENTLTVVSYVDFAAERLRIEYRDGQTLIQVIQLAPHKSQSWSAQNGTKVLGADLARDLHDGLYQNWYGLRLGANGRQSAKLEGERTFADVRGQAVAVTTRGAKTTYLFDAQARLLAERYQSSQGRNTIVYGDFKPVGGILIPFQARIYADGTLFAEAKVKEAKVNPTLTQEVWKMP